MPSRLSLLALSAALVALVASCSTVNESSGRRGPDGRLLSAQSDVPPPAWIDHVPTLPGYHFYVGESLGARNREDALEKAWISAFVRIGMSEFPELTTISTETDESLRRARYRRHYALRLESVNWSGIREATEYGSPYLDWDEKTGRYTVYRLLKWSDKDLQAAHERVRHETEPGSQLPLSPEEALRNEQRLVTAVQAIQDLNRQVDRRNQLLDRVFSKTKCGIKVSDLVRILGKPDRSNPYNENVFEKEYFWGVYKVERLGDDPSITAITREGTPPRRKLLCRRHPDEVDD